MARRTREEVEARDKAIEAAAAAATVKEEAEGYLRKLQLQHGEQVRCASVFYTDLLALTNESPMVY